MDSSLRQSAVSTSTFRFTRLIDSRPVVQPSLEEAVGESPLTGHVWMFVAPHDDDLCIGAGLLIQAAVQAGVDVQCVVVTDGCLGYCLADDRVDIVEIRRQETIRSFELLGVRADQVTFLGFPDGGLTRFIGRRTAADGEPAVAGYTGLQNAFTHSLRDLRPTRVFVATQSDLHPDHKMTNSELMISLFHASGKIWPELGDPLAVPEVHELAVYCDFPADPHLEVHGDQSAFDAKLKSIAAYESQLQIAELVQKIREDGPYEYIRDIEFDLYSPRRYRALFAPRD
ncbi:MAG: PIG-L deacetylase family protein [Planctomycetota bacterium]|jgi:LmbE family N-acetylglucosaminyl deacetylase